MNAYERMWKEADMVRFEVILLIRNVPTRNDENHETYNSESRSLDRNSNQEPLEYERKLLAGEPIYTVKLRN